MSAMEPTLLRALVEFRPGIAWSKQTRYFKRFGGVLESERLIRCYASFGRTNLFELTPSGEAALRAPRRTRR